LNVLHTDAHYWQVCADGENECKKAAFSDSRPIAIADDNDIPGKKPRSSGVRGDGQVMFALESETVGETDPSRAKSCIFIMRRAEQMRSKPASKTKVTVGTYAKYLRASVQLRPLKYHNPTAYQEMDESGCSLTSRWASINKLDDKPGSCARQAKCNDNADL
jgi:hypothetical protein